ncbi:MAG: hypothetical protein OEY60_17725, partial [Nitrospira sp.]|nr:hypothetical protein [Nitrospira sp.]
QYRVTHTSWYWVLYTTWACRWSFIDGHHRTRRATDGPQLTPPPCQVENSREIRKGSGLFS